MTSPPGSPAEGQAARQILLAAAFVLVFGASTALSVALGAGVSAALGGIVGVALVVSAFNGSLGGDLRRLAIVGPAVLLAVVVPRLIGGAVDWLGAVVLALIIFVASLLPGLGPRFVALGLTFGLGAIFGYAYPLPAGATARALVIAVVAAVAVTLVVRVVVGLPDPRAPLRAALAGLFLSPSLAADQAVVQLLRADRPPRWMFDVAVAGGRYQAALAVEALRHQGPPSDRSRALTAAATDVADVVRPAHGPGADAPRILLGDESAAAQALRSAWSAAADRSRAGRVDRHVLALLGSVSLRDLLSWSDPRLRHALRAALAVGAALGIALTRPGDPLMVTLIGMTYGIAQPQWRQTWGKLVRRVVGVGVGGLLLIGVTGFLPQRVWAPLGFAALVVGIGFIERVPAVFYASSAVLTVSAAAVRPYGSPGGLLVEYAIVTAAAALLAVVWGGLLVPWKPSRPAAERIAGARLNLLGLLDHSARLIDQGAPFDRSWSRSLRRAQSAQQDLEDGFDASDAGTDVGPIRLAETALRALDAAIAAVLAGPRPHDPTELRRLQQQLSGDASPVPAPRSDGAGPAGLADADAAVAALRLAERQAGGLSAGSRGPSST